MRYLSQCLQYLFNVCDQSEFTFFVPGHPPLKANKNKMYQKYEGKVLKNTNFLKTTQRISYQ